MNDPVSKIMSQKLITVTPEDTMDKVLKIFKENRIHHLPVVNDDKLIGLITTSDLLWMNKHFDEYDGYTAKDVMSTRLATLEEESKIGTAAQIFLKNWFHALPVLNRDKKLVGIVTSFDVVKYSYKQNYPNEQWDWL